MKKKTIIYMLVAGTLLGLTGCEKKVSQSRNDNINSTQSRASSHSSVNKEQSRSAEFVNSNKKSSSSVSQSKEHRANQEISSIEGDAGAVTIPNEMRGRWYLANAETGKITTIVLGESWITYEDLDTTELHKKKEDFDAYEYGRHHLGYEQKTKNWSEASKSISSETGKVKINVRGWNAGGGNAVYILATEHDQTVLVVESGAGEWVSEVGWRSKSDAERYANEKFGNLHYNSDTDDNNEVNTNFADNDD